MNFKKMLALSTPRWYALKDGEDSARVDISGVIGGSFFGPGGDAAEGTGAEAFIGACRALSAPSLDVHICSPGGDVTEGLRIYSYLAGLRAQGKRVTVHIDGLAASVASAAAMAGDRRIMAESAALHVHNAWKYAGGNAARFRAEAAELEKISGQLAGIYQARTGLPAERIEELMRGPEGADGTLLTAAEALALGFVDEIERNKPAAACVGGDIWDGVPAALTVAAEPEKKKKTAAPGDSPASASPDGAPDPAPGDSPAPGDPVSAPAEDPAPGDSPAPGDPVSAPAEEEKTPDREELERLRRENAELRASASASAACLDRLARNALSPRPQKEGSALSWSEALRASNGDYVKARRAHPAAYAAFMRGAK